MFRQLPGCLGVLFLRSGAAAAALSFWAGQEELSAGTQSEVYRTTVQDLLAARVVRGDTQTISLFDQGFGGFLTPELQAGSSIKVLADGGWPGCLPGI